MRNARALWVALVAALTWLGSPSHGTLGPAPARASVSVALSLQELVDASDQAVRAVAVDKRSRWEQAEGGRRIVTYTKLKIVEAVYGSPAETTWVRTLGGVVGKIGQHVSGEARLALGEECVVFLSERPDDVWVVTGRAQGHFPIFATDGGRKRLRASPDRGKVLPRRGPSVSAHDELVGRELSTALQTIRKAHDRRNARR